MNVEISMNLNFTKPLVEALDHRVEQDQKSQKKKKTEKKEEKLLRPAVVLGKPASAHKPRKGPGGGTLRKVYFKWIIWRRDKRSNFDKLIHKFISYI